MSAEFVLTAESRNTTGKKASRRLRDADKVPAVLYGAGDPVSLTLDHDQVLHQLENEAFYSHILTINVDGKEQQAVLKDVQRHPSKPKILHMDLQRVSSKDKISMQIPLHFLGEDVAPGVKVGGGIVAHLMSSIEVKCLAKDLPEFIDVDLSSLELNESVHLSDLKVPAGVEIVELAHGPEHDLPIASIHATRGGAVEEVAEEAAPGEAEAE
jgi:large subunit ribosomal protein L25